MWLSTCIQALAKPESRKSMAPGASPTSALMSRFRNSKLTLLLSNALSGNSKTSMIGTLSPALANFEESTLADIFCAKNSRKWILLGGVEDSDEDLNVNCVISMQGYSTLTFASTVKNIKIKAKPATAVDKDALVKSLQEELQHLKEAVLQNNMKLLQEFFVLLILFLISVPTFSNFFLCVFLVLSFPFLSPHFF